MSISIARTAVASAIVLLSFAGTAAVAAPQYKLVLIKGTSAVADVANHGWSVASAATQSDERCQRQVCTPMPSLPNGKNLNDAHAYAVNNLGYVVGNSAAGDGTVRHAVYFDGTLTLDMAAYGDDGCDGCTQNSVATALNDKTQIVGTVSTVDGENRRAFLWQSGLTKYLGTLGGHESSATAINRKGHVVGSSERADTFTHAFVYRNGRMHDLGTLGGDLNSEATGINDADQVVANSFGNGGISRAFIHQDGVKTRLPQVDGAQWSLASGINNQGWVVGVTWVTDSIQGWVYDGETTYNLNKILTNFDPRYVIQGARGIADNGQIAVEVFDNQLHQDLGGILVPVQ